MISFHKSAISGVSCLLDITYPIFIQYIFYKFELILYPAQNNTSRWYRVNE